MPHQPISSLKASQGLYPAGSKWVFSMWSVLLLVVCLLVEDTHLSTIPVFGFCFVCSLSVPKYLIGTSESRKVLIALCTKSWAS